MCQSQSCQQLHNRVGTTCTTSPEQIDVTELEGYSRPTHSKLVHSAMTRSTVEGEIHVDEFVDHSNTPKTYWCDTFTRDHGQSVIIRLILHVSNSYIPAPLKLRPYGAIQICLLLLLLLHKTNFEVSCFSYSGDITRGVKF